MVLLEKSIGLKLKSTESKEVANKYINDIGMCR